MKAPEGTQFARFTWSGQARRHDCRYALQLWADRPDGSSVAIKNVRANRGCPNQGKTQAAGWPRAHTYDIGARRRVVQRVLCVGLGRNALLLRPQPQLHPHLHSRSNGRRHEPTRSGDHAGQRVHAGRVGRRDAAGELRGVGQRGGSGGTAGRRRGSSRAASRARATTPSGFPARTAPGSLESTRPSLGEGSQPMALQAEDAAGNLGGSPPVTVRVDNTAPGAVPARDRWRRRLAQPQRLRRRLDQPRRG